MTTRKQTKTRKTRKPREQAGNIFQRIWRRPISRILLGIIVLLIALRIALPYIVLHQLNKTLANMDGYYGHINDIDICLYRGAYQVDSLYLNKVDEKKPDVQTPFVSARLIDLSIEWHALLKGKVVGEIVAEQPNLRFTKDRAELDDVAKDTSDFRDLLNSFMPIDVNRTEIREGTLAYIDNTSSPKVDVAITHLDALATNLRNAYKSNEVLPSTLNANGEVYDGTIALEMKMNPLAQRPQFDLNTNIERTNMAKLNDFFKAYAGFDVSKGTFNMYAEAATKDGKFDGYVKPVIKDLDVVEWQGQDKKDNFFQKVWESVVELAGDVLTNPKKDQIATKVQFKGDLDSPNVNVFRAVITVLQNAFIQALKPSIDNQINLAKVGKEEEGKKKGFFKELFSNDDKDKKKSD